MARHYKRKSARGLGLVWPELILRASQEVKNHGKSISLSPKDVRKITYELAISSNLKVPKPWHLNKLVDSDWFM
ncbi:hypothetical protein ABEB36_008369 [Hypothenemus hampei]|uniref:Uncharacterized protein n=1 Tax=Hypothenemus hampei TaxID=57062 RepID=A0ABD1EM21_HYPHA